MIDIFLHMQGKEKAMRIRITKMERNPLIGFNNGLEITYSDAKHKKNGSIYITLYFEQPDSKRKSFKSAQIDYPGGEFTNVIGYRSSEVKGLWEHVAKAGQLAFSFAVESNA